MNPDKGSAQASGKPSFMPVTSEQETLRTRNDSYPRSPPSIREIFPGAAFDVDEGGKSPLPPDGSSNGESSRHHRTMSAFRDLDKPVHKRGVSWGNDVAGSDRNLQQPALVETNISFSNLPHFHPQRGGSGRINLEELRNVRPMEPEAEAMLLRALDSRDTLAMDRKAAEGSVFANVPAGNLGALNHPEGDAGSAAGSHQSQASNRDSAGEGTTGEGSIASRPSTVRRGPSVRSGGHRRNETIGDQLGSLAAAMDFVHAQNLDFCQDAGERDENLLPPKFQETHPNGEWPASASAADALQQNANMIYQRHRTATEEQIDEEAGQTAALLSPTISDGDSLEMTASMRWRLLQTATAVTSPKQADGSLEASDPLAEVPEGSEDDDLPTAAAEPTKDKPQSSSSIPVPRQNGTYKLGSSKTKFMSELEEFFAPRRGTIYYFLKRTICFVMLPSLGIAAILFYLGENSPTGRLDLNGSKSGSLINTDGQRVDEKTASASWWLLFIGVRQVLTFALAKAVELFFIDFLSVRSKFSVRYFGSWPTLFILQSKGWPFLIFVWGVLNFALLSGTRPFFEHWGYWQDYVDLFNESNPSGGVVDSAWHHRIVAISVSLGLVVAVKRFYLGLYLGRQTFLQYSEKLASVMRRILLISEVASLGRAFERHVNAADLTSRGAVSAASFGFNKERLEVLMNAIPDDSTLGANYAQSEAGGDEPRRVIDSDDRHPLTGSLSPTQKARITQLLGQWEEPTVVEKQAEVASVNELLQFRRALEYLHTAYPFSGSFGLADDRESTVESAQVVYERLLLRSPDPSMLYFDVIALLGVRKDGRLDQEKLKDLIKLFRPDRDGSLACIDFVKSVDRVYKELRLLRASVTSSSKIDRALETILNGIFYVIVGCVIMSQLGYDPLSLFLSVSGVVLAFAFMIGSASAKWVEGVLFILVRRPFQIGDGIAISDVNEATPATGSPFWIVEDVDLFSTKVIYSFSGERATLSNGSVASSRVINTSLSTNAWLYVYLKFPISVTFESLQIFQTALEQYFRNRPREWSTFSQFRATRVEADHGFIEYIVVGQHRLAWVYYGELMQSKADLLHFSMELSKKLDIWYRNPPLPVELNVNGNINEAMAQAAQASQSEIQRQSPVSEMSNAPPPDLTDLQNKFRPQLEWQR